VIGVQNRGGQQRRPTLTTSFDAPTAPREVTTMPNPTRDDTVDERSTLAEALRAERSRASEVGEALADEVGAIIDSADLANTDDEHDPDGATNAFERAQAAALLEQTRSRVRDLDAALARLDGGTYGVCTVCHQSIGTERLDALPATTTCIGCAS
jgi:RNA polymerase-binding transcription factor DksA